MAAPNDGPVGLASLAERFGTYRIVRPLGPGGMGSVYLAEHTQLGRRIAMKVAHLGSSDHPEAVERFYHEGCAAAALDRPYICPIGAPACRSS
jgi:serine/threonine protein kinase